MPHRVWVRDLGMREDGPQRNPQSQGLGKESHGYGFFIALWIYGSLT
jgi:hypothetical protein